MNTKAMYSILLLFSLAGRAEEGILISNAWINEAPPTARVNAAYFSIDNKRAAMIKLIKVHSPAYERIEMHRTLLVNDTVKMQSLNAISIMPQESLKFRPGGYHLMLFEPRSYFKAGTIIDLQFEFADGALLPVRAEVRKLAEEEQQHHRHHRHHRHH